MIRTARIDRVSVKFQIVRPERTIFIIFTHIHTHTVRFLYTPNALILHKRHLQEAEAQDL